MYLCIKGEDLGSAKHLCGAGTPGSPKPRMFFFSMGRVKEKKVKLILCKRLWDAGTDTPWGEKKEFGKMTLSSTILSSPRGSTAKSKKYWVKNTLSV